LAIDKILKKKRSQAMGMTITEKIMAKAAGLG